MAHEPVTLYQKSLGLNNRLSPVRLPSNLETGVTSLQAAYNVDHDESGMIMLRPGYDITYFGSGIHSLFCDGGPCLFVKDTALYMLNSDLRSVTGLRSSMTLGARMSYVQIGAETYYANGYEKGIVRGPTSWTWVAAPYVGPTTTKTFSSPPIGELLEFYGGRIYVVVADVAWYSEPFAYSWFNLASNYIQMKGRIQMIKAVDTGIFISDDTQTVFFAGQDPKSFQLKVVADYPAIRGTAVRVPASMVGEGQQSTRFRGEDRAVMWLSHEGVCVGEPNGTFRNLTERTLVLPDANFGASIYKNGKFITLMEP